MQMRLNTLKKKVFIEICGDEVTYEVTITNNSGSILDSNSLIEVKFPEGIVYVDNTLSAGFSVDTSNYNNPIFSVNSMVNPNEEVVMQFNGLAQCSSYNLIVQICKSKMIKY